MINIYPSSSRMNFVRTIVAEAKVFESMKQKLKFFSSFLRHIHSFDWTSLQSGCFSAAHTGQMMNISLNWGIENFTVWKMSRSNQALFYKSLEVSIDRGQTHGLFTLMKLSMQFLTTQFITTFFEFIEKLLLTFRDFRLVFVHYQDLNLISFTDHTESLP